MNRGPLHVHSGDMHEIRIGRLILCWLLAEDPRIPLWKRTFASDHDDNGRQFRRTTFIGLQRLTSAAGSVWELTVWFFAAYWWVVRKSK